MAIMFELIPKISGSLSKIETNVQPPISDPHGTGPGLLHKKSDNRGTKPSFTTSILVEKPVNKTSAPRDCVKHYLPHHEPNLYVYVTRKL